MRVLFDPRCLTHPAPPGYPERPERLSAILDSLARDTSHELVPLDLPDGVVLDAVARVHAASYVSRFRRATERGDGLLDSADNPIDRNSFAAATGAAAAALAGALWVAEADGRRAFAAVRPPGHHAEAERAMGFCFFNNVAIAAQALIDGGCARVAIVDFDVHHGNGTQNTFAARPDVLFVSLHQYPFYPGSGAAGERGVDGGLGATVNVPLPAGSGDAEYSVAFESIVEPALETFQPEVLLVSAGFDAWRSDPLGGMRLTESAFRDFGQRLSRLADRHARGRLFAVLEGGYDIDALPHLVASFLEGCATA